MIWQEHVFLMADLDALACERDGISVVRERACKSPANPLPVGPDLTLGIPDAQVCLMLVVPEAGGFRGWYQLRLPHGAPGTETRQADGFSLPYAISKDYRVGYAESPDGIAWKPVPVNRVPCNGSTRNNLVDFGVPPERPVRVSWLFHDPLDSAHPFKAVYYRPARGTELEPGLRIRWPTAAERDYWLVWGIGRSRDGLVWEPPPNDGFLIRESPEAARLHRAADGRLVLADQMASPTAEHPSRNVYGWTLLEDGSAARLPDCLFQLPDALARLSARNGFRAALDGVRWVQPHLGLVPLRKGPTWLALHGYLYLAGGIETFAQTAEIGLSVSPDGYRFQELWPLRPFIGCGERGAFDEGMAAQCCLCETPADTRFYYSGGSGNLGGSVQPGLAWIPRDRFGYAVLSGFRNRTERTARGSFTLRPAPLPRHACFRLNADHLNEDQFLRVELQDPQGAPLPGFSLEACRPLVRPGASITVSWSSGADPAALAGASLRVRIELTSRRCRLVRDDSPRLYALYTQSE